MSISLLLGVAAAGAIKGIALGTPEACAAVQLEENGPWTARSCAGNTVNIMWARMWNATHGYAYSTDTADPSGGVAFRRTHDSGETWAVVHKLSPFDSYTDLDWRDWSTAIATGWTKSAASPASTPILLRTGNSGDSWEQASISNLPQGVSVHAMAVAWYVGDKALAGGYTVDSQGVSRACLYHTADAGLTWGYVPASEGMLIDHIHPVTSTQLWFGGVSDDSRAAIWRTENEGASLIREKVEGDENFKFSAAYQVNMKNNGTAAIAGRAIVGSHNTILRYDPPQHTWRADYGSFFPEEQVHMCYNNAKGTAAVAAGATNTLMQPFITQWSEASGWQKALVLQNVTSPQRYNTIYIFY